MRSRVKRSHFLLAFILLLFPHFFTLSSSQSTLDQCKISDQIKKDFSIMSVLANKTTVSEPTKTVTCNTHTSKPSNTIILSDTLAKLILSPQVRASMWLDIIHAAQQKLMYEFRLYGDLLQHLNPFTTSPIAPTKTSDKKPTDPVDYLDHFLEWRRNLLGLQNHHMTGYRLYNPSTPVYVVARTRLVSDYTPYPEPHFFDIDEDNVKNQKEGVKDVPENKDLPIQSLFATIYSCATWLYYPITALLTIYILRKIDRQQRILISEHYRRNPSLQQSTQETQTESDEQDRPTFLPLLDPEDEIPQGRRWPFALRIVGSLLASLIPQFEVDGEIVPEEERFMPGGPYPHDRFFRELHPNATLVSGRQPSRSKRTTSGPQKPTTRPSTSTGSTTPRQSNPKPTAPGPSEQGSTEQELKKQGPSKPGPGGPGPSEPDPKESESKVPQPKEPEPKEPEPKEPEPKEPEPKEPQSSKPQFVEPQFVEPKPSIPEPSVFEPIVPEPSVSDTRTFDPSTFDPSTFGLSIFAPSTFGPSTFDPSMVGPSTFEPVMFEPIHLKSSVAKNLRRLRIKRYSHTSKPKQFQRKQSKKGHVRSKPRNPLAPRRIAFKPTTSQLNKGKGELAKLFAILRAEILSNRRHYSGSAKKTGKRPRSLASSLIAPTERACRIEQTSSYLHVIKQPVAQTKARFAEYDPIVDPLPDLFASMHIHSAQPDPYPPTMTGPEPMQIEEPEPEPIETEPIDPQVTEPIDPQVTEPIDPQVTEPIDPQVTEPEGSQLGVVHQGVMPPVSVEVVVLEDAATAQARLQERLEPQPVQTQLADSTITESEQLEPEHIESDEIGPDGPDDESSGSEESDSEPPPPAAATTSDPIQIRSADQSISMAEQQQPKGPDHGDQGDDDHIMEEAPALDTSYFRGEPSGSQNAEHAQASTINQYEQSSDSDPAADQDITMTDALPISQAENTVVETTERPEEHNSQDAVDEDHPMEEACQSPQLPVQDEPLYAPDTTNVGISSPIPLQEDFVLYGEDPDIEGRLISSPELKEMWRQIDARLERNPAAEAGQSSASRQDDAPLPEPLPERQHEEEEAILEAAGPSMPTTSLPESEQEEGKIESTSQEVAETSLPSADLPVPTAPSIQDVATEGGQVSVATQTSPNMAYSNRGDKEDDPEEADEQQEPHIEDAEANQELEATLSDERASQGTSSQEIERANPEYTESEGQAPEYKEPELPDDDDDDFFQETESLQHEHQEAGQQEDAQELAELTEAESLHPEPVESKHHEPVPDNSETLEKSKDQDDDTQGAKEEESEHQSSEASKSQSQESSGQDIAATESARQGTEPQESELEQEEPQKVPEDESGSEKTSLPPTTSTEAAGAPSSQGDSSHESKMEDTGNNENTIAARIKRLYKGGQEQQVTKTKVFWSRERSNRSQEPSSSSTVHPVRSTVKFVRPMGPSASTSAVASTVAKASLPIPQSSAQSSSGKGFFSQTSSSKPSSSKQPSALDLLKSKSTDDKDKNKKK